MKNNKLTNIALYALPLAAAVLTALPWCVKMQFMGEAETFIKYFSGYSLIPLGYGMWSHMISGVCAVILAVMGLIHARKEDPRLIRWMLIVAIVGLMMSITPFALGTATAVSTLVALAIGGTAVILYRLREDM